MYSGQVNGTCSIPASKSQSMRALFFASLGVGESVIDHLLDSPDIHAMIKACQSFGAKIERHGSQCLIQGVAGQPITPDDVIDAGNSGQVLRFMACLAGLQSEHVVITGDHSIRHHRPVAPLLEALPRLGMHCHSLKGNGLAPLILKGPITSCHTRLCGQDSQPVSGLLMCAPFSERGMEIEVENPGELPWIDLTLSWLDRFRIPYENQQYQYYKVGGGHRISGFHYEVPGDLSTLSFPLASALITGGSLTIKHVDMHDLQGDKAIVDIFKQMGASIDWNANTQTMHVYPAPLLHGVEVNINHCIDGVAILAVVACFASSPTHITGAAIARKKESNRLEVMAHALNAMGGRVTETDDGLIIEPAKLHGCTLHSHHDHRVAMALAVAGLGATGEQVIEDVGCIQKTFPNFVEAMTAIGAPIQEKKHEV